MRDNLSSCYLPKAPTVDSAVYLADLGGRRLAFAAREHAERVVAQWREDRPGQAAQVKEMGREHWEAKAGGEPLNVGTPARWSTWAWDFEPDLYTDLPVR